MIFNIQRYSTHDGDGIRTIVFFKGCTLRCRWCSNPESQSFSRELMYDERICKNFGLCIEKSAGSIYRDRDNKLMIDRKAIGNAAVFEEACPAKALIVTGKEMSPESIMEEIKKDLPYYRKSSGGVTLSGGEPLAQGRVLDMLIALLRTGGIPITVETALHVPWEKIEKRLGKIDMFLADLKHTDEKKFRLYTGGQAGLVMENFKRLAAENVPVIVRITVVPRFNDTIDEMREIIDFAAGLSNVREIHFIRFHTYGAQKYIMLGRDDPYPAFKMTNEQIPGAFETYALAKGLIVKTGG